MKTFTLNPTPQTEAFLAEKRKDPVTGETFKEGDEIVFCASCKSAFLKGSWEYMGGQHCGQSETLEVFPDMSKTEFIINERGGDTIIEFYTLPVSQTLPLKKLSKARQFTTAAWTFMGLMTFLALLARALNGSLIASLFSLLLFISGIIVLIRRFGTGVKRNESKTAFCQSGVFIYGKYISYHDIDECRVSYSKNSFVTRKSNPAFSYQQSKGSEKVLHTAVLSLEFFLHNKKESETLTLCHMSKAKHRQQWFEYLLQISDRLRLVFSPYTLSEKDHEVLNTKAKETGKTYYTKSLHQGYF